MLDETCPTATVCPSGDNPPPDALTFTVVGYRIVWIKAGVAVETLKTRYSTAWAGTLPYPFVVSVSWTPSKLVCENVIESISELFEIGDMPDI
jgi:hypothetical protein